MKRGDIREIKLNGKKIQASFLGKGMFCKAWKLCDDVKRVICFVGEDLSKNILADCGKLKHIPDVTRCDNADDTEYVFEMPYYDPLTSKNSVAWAQYKVLKETADKAFAEVHKEFCGIRKPFYPYVYIYNQRVISNIPDNGTIPNALVDALAEIADTAQNYGSEYAFEFAPRNLKTDEEGNLILLDCIFDAKTLYEMQQERIKRYDNY